MNEPDPLAQLRDIQLPDPVSIWPPAPGWWILAALLLILIGFSIWKTLRYRQQQRYRSNALELLEDAKTLFQKNNNSKAYLYSLTTLLRRTAISAYPKEVIQPLQGREWLQFLDNKIQHRLGEKKEFSFSDGPAKSIVLLPYQETCKGDLSNLHIAIQFWIKNHTTKKIIIEPTEHKRTENNEPLKKGSRYA